jgi:hypothetical protein
MKELEADKPVKRLVVKFTGRNQKNGQACESSLAWPLDIKVLLAQRKRDEAVEKLNAYEILVGECQSPRFTAEAERLKTIVST